MSYTNRVSTPKSKIGRPPKYNALIQAKIIEGIRQGLGKNESCERVGIHRDTGLEWRKTIPAFSDAIKKAEAEFQHEGLRIIHAASLPRHNQAGDLIQGSWQAKAWQMERLFPDRYALHTRTEVTGRAGQPLIPQKPAVDLSGLTKDQLDALILATSLPIPPIAPEGTNGNGDTNGNGHNGQAPH